jgi:ABC-2 type transport system ATP-binding protein
MVIVNKGRIVADDHTTTLKQNLKKGSFLKLSLKNTKDDPVISLLEKDMPHIDIKQVPCPEKNMMSLEIRSPDTHDPSEAIYLRIKQTDWIITEFTKKSQGLEEIFKELTREESTL